MWLCASNDAKVRGYPPFKKTIYFIFILDTTPLDPTISSTTMGFIAYLLAPNKKVIIHFTFIQTSIYIIYFTYIRTKLHLFTLKRQ